MRQLIRGIKTKILCRSFGIPKSTLHYYTRTKLLSGPTVGKGKRGRGHTALWGFEDLIELNTVRRLQKLGIPLQRIRRVLNWLKTNNYALNSVVLELFGDTVIAYDEEGKAFDVLMQQGQGIFLYWRRLVQETKEEFESYSKSLAA